MDPKSLFGLDRFGVLLLLLLTTFLITGFRDSVVPEAVAAAVNLLAVFVGFRATGVWSQRTQIVSVLVVIVTGVMLVAASPVTTIVGGVGALGQAAVLGVLLVAILRRLLEHERVNMSTLIGAIAGYFLIGLMFGWAYLAMRGFNGGPVLEPDEPGVPMYYSFVVLSTLGFGDITPINEFVKRVTAVEAILGQIFLVTLVARLVSMFGTSFRGEPAGQ